ncbi:MAG: hypothetical protein V4726_03355 [Verrucomicrobiota bacterium]
MNRHLFSSLACLWLTGAGVFAETAPTAPPAPVSKSGTPAEKSAAAPAPQTADPNYVRMAEDERSTRMETGLASFALPDGRTVDLVGVVHLGDKAYYKDLNERLGTYDAVLFELVGDPSALQEKEEPSNDDEPPPPAHPLRMIQGAMGRLLRLEFQLENIDYTRPNFIHADATGEEFEKMQKERGESMMQIMLKSLELSSDPEMSEKFRKAQEIGLSDLILMFYSDKAAARFKIVFGGLLAESEQILDKKLLGKNSAIINGRNEVALNKLDEVLKDPAKKRVCIFYGAGHMPSMEASLRSRLKVEPKSFTWLTAWKMPPPEKKPDRKKHSDGHSDPAEKPTPDPDPAPGTAPAESVK